jgi:hypothetical protein
MKRSIGILLTTLTISSHVVAQSINQQTKNLYPIIENGRWGYINQLGNVIIAPKFRSAGQFSEGCAPVRLDGTYGYINMAGDFIIKPTYDVAYCFEKGQAKVFIDAKPYFIDLEGGIAFEHDYAEIHGFGENNCSIVGTITKKYGVINRKGQLLIDTVYKNMTTFSDGLAIVTGLNHVPYPDDEEVAPMIEIGVINYHGKIIVPFGKYKDISTFNNGFAIVELNVERQQGYYDYQGVIDISGKLRFTIPSKKWHFDYGNKYFSEGLAIVELYTVDPDTIKIWSSKNRYNYKGVINTDGKVIFGNEHWEKITPFKNNRAFIQDMNEQWYLINRKGEILNKEPYQNILFKSHNKSPEYFFQNGIQFVQTVKGWGAIDTTGQFTVTPKDIDFHFNSLTWRGDIIFTEKDISIQSDKYAYEYGFWNTQSGEVVEPQFHVISFSEFTDDLIYVMQDGQIGYIDHQGNYVWRAKKKEQQNPRGLNIDYMNRGYFYASSPYKSSLSGFGGSGGSGNEFHKISKSDIFESGKLYMNVNSSKNEIYRETYEGMKLTVANTAQDTLYFAAQDSRLYLNIQAKDRKGEWKDIEYLPSSWCGNSYHSLFLPPDHYWKFTIPVYEGEFKTKLRAQLLFKKSNNQKEDDVLYSNEFDGSINQGQFWRKSAYYPTGLMDSYND